MRIVEYSGKRSWTDWLRLAVEVLFALIILAVWVWLAFASSAPILTAIFALLAIGTVVVAGRLTYLEACGAKYRLLDGALHIRARWFIEDIDIPYAKIKAVRKLDPDATFPASRFFHELDDPASEDAPYVYIGWPSREGLVEIRLTEERSAKYKLPQDFDPRDMIQALPCRCRRIKPSRFERLILSAKDRDSLIEELHRKSTA